MFRAARTEDNSNFVFEVEYSRFSIISSIILTYFKPLLYQKQTWMSKEVSVCFGPLIVHSYFKYQSAARVLDTILNTVLVLEQ